MVVIRGMIFAVTLGIMGIFHPTYNININLPGSSDEVLQKLTQMAENFDQLKAKVEAQTAQLDTINTGVTGITDDIAYLKEQLAGLENGATAEQIAELSAIVDGANSRLTTLGTQLSDLDAQTTRPTNPEPEA